MKNIPMIKQILSDHPIKSEKDAFRKLAELLEHEESVDIPRREQIYSFYRKTGIQIVPKLKAIMEYVFDKVEKKEIVRVIVRGPRGGGKTFGIASCIEFPLWFFFDFDCVNLSGSASQAQKAYRAIRALLQIPEVTKHVKSSLQSVTEKYNGTFINVLAASTRQVRSPHPGGIDKGGLMLIDEECEIQDQTLVDAAKPLVNSANPSVIIRVSTQHKVGDTFEECWDNAEKQGYKRFESNIFDACQTCTRDCRISIEQDKEKGCHDFIRKDTYNREGNVERKGYCKGKAHHDGIIYETDNKGNIEEVYNEEFDWHKKVDGWVSIDEIFQGFIESDRETFEVEWMGKTKSKKGKVYDPALIDEACIQGINISRNTFRRCSKSIGIDWGFAGMCVVTYYFVFGKNIYLYWIDCYQHTGMDDTIGDIYNRAKMDNHQQAFGDSEGAYENEKLNQKVMTQAVTFGTLKDFGISNIKNMLEKRILKVLRNFDGRKNPGFDVWYEQMKSYRYDDHGKPLKKNDHAPDSTLCGLIKWAPKRYIKRGGTIMDEPRIHSVR